MKKIFIVSLLSSIIVGCVVKEELNLKKDMTGGFTLSCNVQQAKGMFQAMGADSLYQVFDRMEEHGGPIAGIPLDSVEGINSIALVIDKEKSEFGINIGFDHPNKISEALKQSSHDFLRIYTGKEENSGAVYGFKKGALTFDYALQSANDLPEGWESLEQLYNMTTFIFVITSEAEIISCSNDIFNISENRKEARLEMSREQLYQARDSLFTTFKFDLSD